MPQLTNRHGIREKKINDEKRQTNVFFFAKVQINEKTEVFVVRLLTECDIPVWTPLTIEILSILCAFNMMMKKPAKHSEILRKTHLNYVSFNNHLISLNKTNLIKDWRRGSLRLLQVTDQGRKLVDNLPLALTRYRAHLNKYIIS